MTLPLRKQEEHWPQTIGDVARQLGCSVSCVRFYCLTGIVQPATDSRRRRLFMPPDVERIVRHRKALHGE